MAAACLALASGFGALRFPNGTRTHKRLGVVYLAAWGLLSVSGFTFVSSRPGIDAFGVCAPVGTLSVAMAYGHVLFRRRLGRGWLRGHYQWMLLSLAALLGPSTNQLLWHLGLDYPREVVYLVCGAPLLVWPFYRRRLDLRYGFAEPGRQAAL